MKKNIPIFLVFLIFAALFILPVSAEGPVCATCGKEISGTYKEYMGKPYCSLECLGAALPKCSVCGRPTHRQIRSGGDSEKVYCSWECYQTILPKCEICGNPLKKWVEIKDHAYCDDCARLPKCLNCRLPGADRKLDDGRHICRKCGKTAIFDPKQAQANFVQVREDLYRHLGLRTGHRIQFDLKDAVGLARLAGNQSSNEHGFYSCRGRYRIVNGIKTLESETYAIYIISALSPPYFRNAAAHELAHDLCHALYPRVKNTEDVEGFAEYLSSLMNSYWGNESLNQEKLRNQERDYARAYKKFLKIGEKNGLKGVMSYLEKQNR